MIAQNLVKCPYCGAEPKHHCVTSSGAVATSNHDGRSRWLHNLINAEWHQGFEEGKTYQANLQMRQQRQHA